MIPYSINPLGTVSRSFDVTFLTTSANESILLPIITGYNYNMNVDWGDSSSSTITAWDDIDKTHTYLVAGTYKIRISGVCEAWCFISVPDSKDKVLQVHFGLGVEFKYISGMFRSCINLEKVTGTINAPTAVSVDTLFHSCGKLWSVSETLLYKMQSVSNMSGMFKLCVSLENMPSVHYCPNLSSVLQMYYACPSLKSIREGYLDNNAKITNLAGMFGNNTGLTGSSRQFWLNPSGASNYTLTAPDYDSGVPNMDGCYAGCINLDDYATMPTFCK